jgi:hypothetical protein
MILMLTCSLIIRLENNDISDAGVVDVIRALEWNSTLNSVGFALRQLRSAVSFRPHIYPHHFAVIFAGRPSNRISY